MSIELALLSAFLLLMANAFFVGAEFSLVSVRRSAIETDVAQGSRRALTTLKALEDISVLMAGAQLGITLCSLALGAVAEPAIAYLLEGPFSSLHIAEQFIHPLSFAIALTVTVFLHVVIGEMVPKNIALAKPETMALFLTPKLVYVVKILNPLVSLLNTLANAILRMFNVRPKAEVSSTYTRDEMADLVKESRRSGYLSKDNEELLSGALSFDTRTVKDIAIPLDSLTMVSTSATYGEIEALSIKSGFSRFPVTGRKNRILGYVHIKDVIRSEKAQRGSQLHTHDIRKLAHVSSSQSIRMTLKIMQHSGAHMALVISGKNTLGLVTLEDVLEELVGEIRHHSKASK